MYFAFGFNVFFKGAFPDNIGSVTFLALPYQPE
jgi:hypothetical protein